MTHTIYSATGCARCKITKRFMGEQGIEFEEHDIKADGKDAFAQFYRANRSAIFRDKDGVEFPVFTDGRVIRQGVSVVIGHLIAGDDLKGFIDRSALHGEWIDGFNISDGNPDRAEGLLRVLSYLKKNGLKIQLTTTGKNATVLEQILTQGLGDRVIMEIKGPAAMYEGITGKPIDDGELSQSIGVTAKFDDYQFSTTVAPVKREDGQISYLTPEEIGETANMIETATGSKTNPYELQRFDPAAAADKALQSIEVLPDSTMFKYRTAARRFQVKTEFKKY